MNQAIQRVLPSIRSRVARTLLLGAVLWIVAVSVVVALAARHEAAEFLDENLKTIAQVMAAALELDNTAERTAIAQALNKTPAFAQAQAEFAWQLVSYRAQGTPQVDIASNAFAGAPALFTTPHQGFEDAQSWRVYAIALGGSDAGQPARLLYVAQSLSEREETQWEVALAVVLASVVMASVAYLILNAKLQKELAPLQHLADRLSTQDALEGGSGLGAPERQELQPIHQALDVLAANLALRLSNERAFSAHAAHALRTPLAGIDAQLAVAQRESPPHLQTRLQTIRSASSRLQCVVTTLLTLFRSGSKISLQQLDVKSWALQLPWEGLGRLETTFEPESHSHLRADPDLLTAAVLNLLDNADRYGAHRLTLSIPRRGVLRLHDDGPGMSDVQRAHILQSLAQASSPSMSGLQRQEEQPKSVGLGLLLADMVARAHGGRLLLPKVTQGFAVELELERV